MQKHLLWCEDPSPFISTFANRNHAENWARNWSTKHDNQTCHILEIEIKETDNVIVFHVDTVVKKLGNVTLRRPSEYRSEYLCLHRIPEELIVGGEEINSGMRDDKFKMESCVAE